MLAGVLALSCGLASPAWAAGQAVPVAEAARGREAAVTVNFLADGRCTVSSTGEGFRSKVTYKPQVERRGGELRCAFPPVEKGMTVQLRVTLPAGASAPGETRPALFWVEQGGTWTGTATLTSWPEAIVVAPVDRPWLFWLTSGLALLVLAMAARRWAGRRRRPQPHPAAATA